MSVPTITVNGRLGSDPKTGTSQSGRVYTRVFVISSSHRLNRQTNQWEEGDRFAIGGVAFDDPQRGTTFATNIARSLHKGDAVVMTGRIRENRNPNAAEGTPPTVEMLIDDIAPSLRYATAQVVRNQHAQQQPQQQPQQPQQSYGSPEQAWGGSTDFGGYGDDAAF